MFVVFLQKKNLEIGFLHKIGVLYKLEVCGAPAPLAAEGPEKGGRTQRKGPLEGGPPLRQLGQPASPPARPAPQA